MQPSRSFGLRLVRPVVLAATVASSFACAREPTRELVEESGGPVFVEAALEQGLDFEHDNGMSGERYMVEMMGPGTGLADVDGDGDLDAVLLQGMPLDLEESSHWTDSASHRIFLNQLVETGQLGFVSAGDRGLSGPGYAMGVSIADIDNDGDRDLYIAALGPSRLLENDGTGTFTDITAEAGVEESRWTVASSFFDFDQDGWLDLFVGNYVRFDGATHQLCYDDGGLPDYCGPSAYEAVSDRLYRNRGDGTFEDVTVAAGLGRKTGPALGALALDVDRDGWLDLFVANDDAENFLWRNQGDGTFVEEGLIRGVAVNGSGGSEGSMGIAVGDYDLDGDEDVLLTHLVGESNTLYRNDAGYFFDVTSRAGLAAPSIPFTGFGTGLLDWDLDGDLDLVVVNGAVMEKREQPGPLPLRERDQLFENLGDATFAERRPNRSRVHAREEVSRGAAFGDVDNDGDVDVLISDVRGRPRLWLAQATDSASFQASGSAWLGMHLIDHGRDALGAVVELTDGRGVTWTRRSRTDGSYASAHDARLVFGVGSPERGLGVTVTWVGGDVEHWLDLTPDRYHTLVRGQGSQEPASSASETGSGEERAQ